MWTLAGTGLLTGLALIVAIGAQNAFVLRQGVRREHVGAVVLVCMASDAVLILAGTAGVGALVQAVPWLLEVLRWGGALYLLWFAVSSLRAALRPQGLMAEQAPRTAGSVIATTLALTWLNPHVYLDTVVLLGSLANQHGPDARWVFAAGAVAASVQGSAARPSWRRPSRTASATSAAGGSVIGTDDSSIPPSATIRAERR